MSGELEKEPLEEVPKDAQVDALLEVLENNPTGFDELLAARGRRDGIARPHTRGMGGSTWDPHRDEPGRGRR